MVYICNGMQSDNNWLVDKLAELEEERNKFGGSLAEFQEKGKEELKDLLDLSLMSQ